VHGIARHDREQGGDQRRDREEPEEDRFPAGKCNTISDFGMRIADLRSGLSLSIRNPKSAFRNWSDFKSKFTFALCKR
jgi:hypothetical protein